MMAEIVGVGQLALMDLNDAIISGAPPSNPVVGTLWIDESQDPAMLKKWNGEAWIDLGELDPDLSVTIEDITETLGNMANDNIINFQERQVIKDKLTEIIGYVIADTEISLPDVSTLDNSGKGSFWSVRKSARNVGISTSDDTYVNVATKYNNLKSYLESLTPIVPWDTRNANADVVVPVTKSTFRDMWLQYYLAVDALAELTAQKIKENNDELKDDVDVIGRDLDSLTGRVTNVESKVTDTAIVNTVTRSEAWVEQINVINDKVSKTEFENLQFGGRNLLLDSNDFTKFDRYMDATADFTTDVSVPEWNATDATRIQVSGGTHVIKLYKNTTATPSVSGQDYTISVWIKNIGSYPVVVSNNLSGESTVNPEESKRVIITSKGNGLGHLQVQFRTTTENENNPLDFIVWRAKAERGNKATDWTRAPEDIEDSIDILTTRINNVEQEITADKIVTTITESTTFQNILDSKADAESLGGFATKDELDELSGEVDGKIDDAIQGIDFSPYATKLELEETSRNITAKFSATGGMNLLKNSIGFAGFDFWSKSGNAETIKTNELDILGFGSGFLIRPTGDTSWTTISQTVPVVSGQPYTLSWYYKKLSSGDDLWIQILEDDVKKWEKIYSGTTDGFVTDNTTYIPESNTITVRLAGHTNSEAIITGIMLTIGDVPLQWTLATGEVYNTNIRMDINGIRVSQLDKDRQEIGYTQITPDEFAGYYDIEGNGTFEKVFYLNGEETVTKKFRALNEITMGGIKVININSRGRNGWAFVPITE